MTALWLTVAYLAFVGAFVCAWSSLPRGEEP
jgi:hypothetical protein